MEIDSNNKEIDINSNSKEMEIDSNNKEIDINSNSKEMDIDSNNKEMDIDAFYKEFCDGKYKLDSILFQVTNKMFFILLSIPLYGKLWSYYAFMGGEEKIAHEFAERPVETTIILRVIVRNLDRNIERIKLSQDFSAEAQKNLIDSLQYFITNCSLFVPDLDSKNILNQKELELIDLTDGRRKHIVHSKKKAYVIRKVFGERINSNLSKDDQIKLFHLITGDSGAHIYNLLNGNTLYEKEKEELDNEINEIQRIMR
ncbi:hypothetical protein N8987_02580 [Crocinitomix sp.]|nr:hypothetical protein [Crocinitomix sp.]